jgi:hypothetical protein
MQHGKQITGNKREIWGSHSGVAEDSILLQCDAVSLGPQIAELNYRYRRHWHSTYGLFNDAISNSEDITITKTIFSEK